jgi:hypothetical protein
VSWMCRNYRNGQQRPCDSIAMTPYLESLLNMKNMAELRFFRRCTCCDDELESTEGAIDSVDDCLDLGPDVGRSLTGSCLSIEGGARASIGGILLAEGRSLGKRWSLDVREGADVKLVDWVSWECIDLELLWSLSIVMVDMAREILFGGDTKRYGSVMPDSRASSAKSASRSSSF